MKKKILKGLGGAGLFLFLIAGLAALHQLTIAGTVTKPFTFSPGGTIKSSEINSNYDTLYNEFNGNIDNNNVKASAGIAPSKIDDYSTNATQMQTTTDPGDVGSESLPTSLQGEIERLRFKIKQIVGGAQWYSDTPIVKASIPSAVAYEDEANTFTANQKISKSTPVLLLNDTTTNGRQAKIVNNPSGGTTGTAINNLQIRTNEADAFDVQQDATQPSWAMALHEGSNDRFALYRKPAGGVFGAILAFDNAGKMTAGIVPLARMGVSGSFTTASLETGGSDSRDIAHGLGTDNVKVLVFAQGSVDREKWLIGINRPDGTHMSARGSGELSATLTGITVPSSGNVRFHTVNPTTNTQTFTVKYTILRED